MDVASLTGHVLYLSTLVGTPGQFAAVQLSVKVPAGDHCLQFFYSMVSTGAIRVRYFNISTLTYNQKPHSSG